MIITSPHNEKLKEIRRLNARRRDREHFGRFVAEGEDLLAAADVAGWRPVEKLVAMGSGLPGGVEVEPELLAGVSELGSGTRALGVYEIRWADQATGPVCVYLHGVGDPGNVGTILRAAEAFGASCVALGPGSADPFSPKAVRASMGAIFTVPVVRCGPDALPGTTIALDAAPHCPSMGHMSPLRDNEPVSILIGAEREGLPQEVLDAADHTVRIPIQNHSLNAAMAATIALYELTRRMPSA
jgi:TrmH family RNA methyltransferase